MGAAITAPEEDADDEGIPSLEEAVKSQIATSATPEGVTSTAVAADNASKSSKSKRASKSNKSKMTTIHVNHGRYLAGKSAKKQQLGLDQAFFLSSKSSKISKAEEEDTANRSKGQGAATVDAKAAKPKGTSQSAILDDEKKNVAAKTEKYETNEDVDLEEFIQRPFGRAKVAKKKKAEVFQ